VNGQLLGTPRRRLRQFSYDVTGALRAGGNEVIVGVGAPVESQDIPVSKQRLARGGIMYTPIVGHLGHGLAGADQPGPPASSTRSSP
jgi:hypothetical protein